MTPLRNIFGDDLEVLGHCPRCKAPKTRPVGTKDGATLMHKPGCGTALGNEGHKEAVEWSEQSMERDYVTMKARGDFTPTYDAHLRPVQAPPKEWEEM